MTAVDPLPLPAYGDETFGYHVALTIAAQGQSLPLFNDVVFVGKGRAEVQGVFFSVGGPFDPDLETKLIDALGTRAQSA